MTITTSVKSLLFCAIIFLGCGGGGSSTPSQPTPVTPPVGGDITVKRSSNNLHFYHPDNFYQGQAAAIAVRRGKNAELIQIKWSQISGPSLTFLAPNSQVIGFDIPQSGDYQVRFEGTTNNNNNKKPRRSSVSFKPACSDDEDTTPPTRKSGARKVQDTPATKKSHNTNNNNSNMTPSPNSSIETNKTNKTAPLTSGGLKSRPQAPNNTPANTNGNEIFNLEGFDLLVQ